MQPIKKILVLGCSFSGGHGHTEERYFNWPAELALLTDDKYEIINAASGGSSIPYSMFILSKYLEEHTPDFVVFQFTLPYRKSWVHTPKDATKFNDIFEIITQREYMEGKYHVNVTPENYRYDNLKNFKRIFYKPSITEYGFIAPGNKHFASNNIKNLYELYYGITGGDRIEEVVTNSYYSFVKNLLKDIPHLICAHQPYINQLNEFQKSLIDVVFSDILGGDEAFYKCVIDQGKHLNLKALKRIALEMKRLIENKIGS